MDFTDEGNGLLTVLPGYPATNPPSGIFRKVEANYGSRGLSAWIGLPSTEDSSVGEDQFSETKDQGYIYTGGGAAGWEVDAGLQLGHTGNEGWKPYIIAKKGEDATFYGKPKRPMASGEYWITTTWPILMGFRIPGLAGTPSGTVALSFESPSGEETIVHYYRDPTTHQPVREVIPDCLFVCTVPGWKSNTSVRIKRVNSIAQDKNYLANHPTYGTPGYAPIGSYVLNASWGDVWDLVTLLPGGEWTSGRTYRQGGFPGYPYVRYLTQVEYSWETMITLDTNGF